MKRRKTKEKENREKKMIWNQKKKEICDWLLEVSGGQFQKFEIEMGSVL